MSRSSDRWVPEVVHPDHGGSLPRIDAPEEYQPRSRGGYARIEDGAGLVAARASHTELQQRQLEVEKAVLKLDPDAAPDAFVRAHREVLDGFEQELTGRLPELKERIIEGAATRLAAGNEDTRASLAALMRERLAATDRVTVVDSLAGHDNGIQGAFVFDKRLVALPSSAIMVWLNIGMDMETLVRDLMDVNVGHEVMHGMVTAGSQTTYSDEHVSIRNGLRVANVENPMDPLKMRNPQEGSWLSEGTLESFRHDLLGTRKLGRRPEVLVVNTLDALAPGLRDRLMLGALDRHGPGPLFAEVEALLGPLAVSEMPALLAPMQSRESIEALEALKDAVIARLPEGLRERGRQAIEAQERRIYGSMPGFNKARARWWRSRGR